MASRPRRSAAQRATAAITDLAADRDSGLFTRTRHSTDGKDFTSSRDRDRSMDRPSSSASADSHHMPVTVKVASSKLRQATTTGSGSARGQISVNSRDQFVGGEILAGKRSTRGAKKRYIESDSDDDDEDEEEEEEEEQDEIQVGDRDADGVEDDDDDDEMEDLAEEDAEGEVDDDMDVDAEGEDEDAEGDVDMEVDTVPTPAAKATKPPRRSADKRSQTTAGRKPTPRKPTAQRGAAAADDDDDELSELDSEVGDANETALTTGGDGLGDEDAEGEDDNDLDAEGEEIEVAAEDDEDDDEDLGSDGETPGGASREDTPDLTKMTKRQRARFEDEPQEYMKLSNEVQAKKHFTAEELSMRRAEMARRRRNLSEKRNEEVKMETINKLLKKQEKPKGKGRAGGGAADDDSPENEAPQANPMFIRWVSNKSGSQISVPVEIIESPVGRLFAGNGTVVSKGAGLKMVQEVS